MSQLENLSAIDFEDLCRDIATIEVTKKRFEAFGPGPDGGIDGRHSTTSGSTILQCKHYIGSKYSNLKSVLKNKELTPKWTGTVRRGILK